MDLIDGIPSMVGGVSVNREVTMMTSSTSRYAIYVCLHELTEHVQIYVLPNYSILLLRKKKDEKYTFLILLRVKKTLELLYLYP